MTDKVSYALGLSIGSNLKGTGVNDLVVEDFVAGVKAIFEMTTPSISPEEAQNVLGAFFEELQNKTKNANLEAGRKYMEENKNKPGVVCLENGLQYEILEEGSGRKPVKTDTVTVHYEGTLTNGAIFDSSIKRGEPASFPLTGVISGWTEILQLMPVGSKWRVTIPAHMAYGERGAGQMIGPNATLVFEIHLLAIEDQR
ncbi:FKBP-type peptidyl-prolyl cis-trans isomerase [Porphyromonas circumdentaria]|uniref:Peptidyl-prolyl cis-trans isomerase n=1 Tax=Porphyromonas circumdentaria TaxID=29524 RepID=A0A1T4PJG7_9PORP|nr:FKBP-type peptidyl-prolyl cis-trans isomerase [Porphyromonas circumdentaria]MBB6276405.1 FKBP-type peptidyl-prolyl cis-trans isomerase FklB [Porphyromonas circumdentaria]MDO4722536.1 FKBP-type peptidyl-prolyl cis-trans isomerase [Porphyromonas circumdentaria]SJZ91703.1 FKBP-type peptidyl-prolyl cis-trans isomerase FklB [Porphyromonas circumdentaria]